MKKITVFLIISSVFILGFTLGKTNSDNLLQSKKMTQVGIIVKDVEKSAEAWSAFLGLTEVPGISIAEGHESVPTEYNSKPTKAKAKLAFFQLDNITIELIEPLGGESTWQEFLDENGEGIHHIAFQVEDMDTRIAEFDKAGLPLIQRGGWGSGEYSYVEGSDGMAVIIELLENYKQ